MGGKAKLPAHFKEHTMKNKTLIRDFTKGPILNQLLKFATPFMMSNLLQTVYNLIDMIVVGQVLGPSGLSAVATGGEVLHVFTFVCMGLTTAGQVLIAQLVGRKEYEKLNQFIGGLFTVVALVAIIFSVFGFVALNQLLTLLNVPAEAYHHAKDYMLVCFFGLIFIYGYNVVSGILQGMGDSKHPFIFIAIASVTNLILDVIFVAVFKWGALGAALATVIGQGLSFLTALRFLISNRKSFGFDFRISSFRIRSDALFPLLRLGIPMCLQFCAINVSNLFINGAVNSYGVVCSAISGVGGNLNSVIGIVSAAMISAGSTMIGQNFGAREVLRVKKVFRSITMVTVSFAAIMSLVVLAFPEQVFSIFSNDPAVLSMANLYAPVSALCFMGAGFRASSIAFINGIGATTMNYIMGIMDGLVVRIGLAWIMEQLLGITGLWYGSAIAGFMFFVVGFPYFLSGTWKKRIPEATP